MPKSAYFLLGNTNALCCHSNAIPSHPNTQSSLPYVSLCGLSPRSGCVTGHSLGRAFAALAQKCHGASGDEERELSVDGLKSFLVVYRYNLSVEEVLVVVRVERRDILGMFKKPIERGVVIARNGRVREASEFELVGTLP